MKNRNILIIGGTGFIGYHFAKELLKKKFSITSISLNLPKKIRFLKKVKYLKCDITKKKSLDKTINNNFGYVINFGGYVDHNNKVKTYRSHFKGCKNLAEIFLKRPPKLFLQIGSSVEYGKKKSPQKENMKCNLLSNKSTYGRAKLSATKYLLKLHKKNNFPVTIIRPYLIYGPKQDFNRLIPITIKGCLQNKTFNTSSGKQIRNFLHVKDFVSALFKLLKYNKTKGQIFNIGAHKSYKVKTVIEKIKKYSKGGKPKYGIIPLRKDEIKELYPSIEKLKKTINWKPRISLDQGIKSTINSYKIVLK